MFGTDTTFFFPKYSFYFELVESKDVESVDSEQQPYMLTASQQR